MKIKIKLLIYLSLHMAETTQNGKFIGVYSLWPVLNYGRQVMVMNGKLVITYSKRNEIIFKKILVYTLVILSALLWTACNHLEWRGSAIPKLVWSKSDRISIKDIQSERSINSLNNQNRLLSSTPYWTQFRVLIAKGNITKKF